MIEIKFVGRGGQGVVVASELLAHACFEQGLYPQSFSIFGGERRGAPVAAFIRVSDSKIYLKCDINHADHLVCFDPSMFNEELAPQLKPGGTILVNSAKKVFLSGFRVASIDALQVSNQTGLFSIVNTSMLGAYAGFTNICDLESMISVIRRYVPSKIEENIAACRAGYGRMRNA